MYPARHTSKDRGFSDRFPSVTSNSLSPVRATDWRARFSQVFQRSNVGVNLTVRRRTHERQRRDFNPEFRIPGCPREQLMKNLKLSGYIAALLLLSAALVIAADAPAPDVPIDGAEIEKSEQAPKAAEQHQATCFSQCDSAEGLCGAEVRHARTQCSRSAANAGRDPMTMRNNDYTYFCGYWTNPGLRCELNGGGNCQVRFEQRHALCVDAMQNNIAAMRHDCFLTERKARNFCREELRDCKADCRE